MKFIRNNEETTSAEGQMVYRFSRDLLYAVLLHHSTAEHTQRPPLLRTVIYSPSSKSRASWKASQT